jgi:hypothetical protein
MAFNLKTRIWQTGALDWWAMLDNEDIYLGNREFPLPPEEGDEWHVKKTVICSRSLTVRFARSATSRTLLKRGLNDSGDHPGAGRRRR